MNSMKQSHQGVLDRVGNNVQNEFTIGIEKVEQDDEGIDGIEPIAHDIGVQCHLLGKFSIENLVQDPKRVQYYTGGFDDYNHFMFFLIV